MSELDDLKKKCENCHLCPLARTRIKVVFGKGSENPKIVCCGESPGRNEDETGLPFVGAAGKVLDGLFAKAGLTEKDYYVLNTVKCRPPENRDPTDAEKEICTKWLDKQIAILNPDIILTLGNHATKYMFGQSGIDFPGITAVRGKLAIGKDGRKYFPTFHPAAAIYDRSKMEIIENDFAELKKILTELAAENSQPDLSV